MGDTPSEHPSDPPLITVSYNEQWHPLLLFALRTLEREQYWRDGVNDVDTDIIAVKEFILLFIEAANP